MKILHASIGAIEVCLEIGWRRERSVRKYLIGTRKRTEELRKSLLERLVQEPSKGKEG